VSYRITIKKIETTTRPGRREWKQVRNEPAADGGHTFDYVQDPNEYSEEKETAVLSGEVEAVNLPALVALLWPVRP